jgi:hypothetical protein
MENEHVNKNIYLGDGLYLEDQGFQFRLFTPQGNEVFMDETVLESFIIAIENYRNVKFTITKA